MKDRYNLAWRFKNKTGQGRVGMESSKPVSSSKEEMDGREEVGRQE